MHISWIQWILLLLPWATLLLARKEARKRYMPVVLLSVLFMTVVSVIGYTLRWWSIDRYILHPFGKIVDPSFVYGIFSIGTFWIFYFSSRKLWVYMAVNIGINALFSFAIVPLMDRMGIITMLKLPLWGGFAIDIGISLILYGYFKWQDVPLRSSGGTSDGRPYRTQKPRFLNKNVHHDRRSRLT